MRNKRVPFLRNIIAEDRMWVGHIRNGANGRFQHCDPRTGEEVVRTWFRPPLV